MKTNYKKVSDVLFVSKVKQITPKLAILLSSAWFLLEVMVLNIYLILLYNFYPPKNESEL